MELPLLSIVFRYNKHGRILGRFRHREYARNGRRTRGFLREQVLYQEPGIRPAICTEIQPVVIWKP